MVSPTHLSRIAMSTHPVAAWVENGGIVGRGVLLDYVGYCERNGITADPFKNTSIPLEHILAVVKEQGVTFRDGDILFLRAGFTKAYDALSPEQQKALPERESPDFMGVEPTVDVLRWIWESGFAAVASDVPGFEQTPVFGPHVKTCWAGQPWEDEMQGGGLIHQWLLGGWGLPIGEMFDLEALAAKAKELGRWSFFVSSVPLKVRLSGPSPVFEDNCHKLTAPLGPWWRREPA